VWLGAAILYHTHHAHCTSCRLYVSLFTDGTIPVSIAMSVCALLHLLFLTVQQWFDYTQCTMHSHPTISTLYSLNPILTPCNLPSLLRNIVGLAIGYSKAIVVDMGFCLQVRKRTERFFNSGMTLLYCVI
jgi:hypothetical protein